MEKQKTTLARSFILVLLLITSLIFIYMIRSYLIPLILAALTSALIIPIHNRFVRLFRGKKRAAALVTILLLVLIIGIPMLFLLGAVTNEAVALGTKAAPWIAEQLGDGPLFENLIGKLPFGEAIAPYSEQLTEKIYQAAVSLGNLLVNSIPQLTRGALTLFLNVFIYLYALFSFILYGSRAVEQVITFIPLSQEDSRRIVTRGMQVIRASLKGILVIGILQGTLITLSFWIIGIEGALFWGLIVVVLSAIPAAGTPLVWGPAALWLAVSGRIGAALALTAWGVLVVGLVDNILRPMVVGRDAKLPDLLILISILGGLGLFGPSGILIGPVIASAAVTVLDIYQHMFSKDLSEASGK